MRILFISYFFPPFNTVGAVRTGKTARYLSRFGHDVRVITAADPGLEPTLPVEIAEEHVTRVVWPTFDQWLQRILHRRRAALSGSEAAPPAGRPLMQWLGRAYRTVTHFPDDAIAGAPAAGRAALTVARGWKPDLIFASASPPTSLVIAAALSRKLGVPWVGELRDLWTDNHSYPYGPVRRALDGLIERKVLRSAAGLVTVSDPLAERLRAIHRRPTVVVTNGFDPADYPAASTPQSGPPLRILYTGQVFAGFQDPRPLLDALVILGADAGDVRVTFLGKFLRVSLEETLADAACLGVAASVRIEAPVTHTEALRRQCEADALLLLSWMDPRQPGVFTTKLFEYAGSRRPILSVGGGRTVADEAIRANGLGVVAKDARHIAEVLRGWLETKREGRAIPGVPESNTMQFTREAQTRILEGFLMEHAARA